MAQMTVAALRKIITISFAPVFCAFTKKALLF